MNAHNDDFLYGAINAKLEEVAEAASPKPPWYEAWLQLGAESTEEERLAVYRAIRDSGCLPDEAGFYLVAWQIDAMASLEAESRLASLDEQMRDLERSRGLEEGAFWPPGKEPKAYEELRQQYQAAWDEIYVAQLKQFGEHEMAEQYRIDPAGFHRRSEAGRAFFHGPQDPEDADAPEWLHQLAEAVASNLTSTNGPGPMGLLYREEEGLWELVIYPTPVELVGGAEDGEIVSPGFSLDLEGTREAFDEVTACSWQSLGWADGEGPHVSIEGVYQGHEVLVQVLAYAPEDEEPGMKLHCSPPKR